jgi:hypothetical protein
VVVRPESNEVSLSQIFRWYQADFGGRDGVVEFLIHYLPNDGRRDFLRTFGDNVRLVHEPYNWDLNGYGAAKD